MILVQVPAGSAAAKAGLKQGDVILKCQGREISSMDELFRIFGGAVKGSKITLDLWRLKQHVAAEIPVE